MDERPNMTFIQRQQPLTPISPLLPTTLPQVCEPIPILPMTPPDADEILDAASNAAALRTALHVIATERDGLTSLGQLYETNSVAQEGFMKAVTDISRTIHRGAKVVVSGVGKSGKIGEKVVATMNSFGIRSAFLHPTEALHGDMGMIAPSDTLLLLTFSGRTAELLQMLHYIRPSITIIAITSHTEPSTCPLFAHRPAQNCILLPAPIPIPETVSFGLPAPTTSTTAALALSDALALAIARRLHLSPADVFHRYHPGGAIGASAEKKGPPVMADLATIVADVPIAQRSIHLNPHSSTAHGHSVTVLDILLTAARSTSGWVRLSPTSIISPLQIQILGVRYAEHLESSVLALQQEAVMGGDRGFLIEKGDWISVPAGSEVDEVRDWIGTMRRGRGRAFLREGTVLGIVDADGNVSGVVEIENVGWIDSGEG